MDVSSISGVKLSNFRAFSSATDLPLRQITLLFGQNSAGKSSVIKSLLLLQQSLSSRAISRHQPFVFSGDSVDLGSFSAVVSNHDTSRTMGISVSVPASSSQPRTDLSIGDSAFELGWSVNHDQSVIGIELTLADRTLGFSSMKTRDGVLLALNNESINDFVELFDEKNLFSSSDSLISDLLSGDGWRPCFRASMGGLVPGQLVGLERGGQLQMFNPIHLDVDPDESAPMARQSSLRESWGVNIGRIRNRLSSHIKNISYIGPLRQEPQRFGRYTPTEDRDVGSSGENMLSALFANRRLVIRVNRFLNMMEMPYDIRIHQVEAQETLGSVIHMSLVNNNTRIELAPTDVGVGYSQILPLITQAALSEQNLVCVEQPELHLHPAMQARVADVFIDAATSGSRVQFLIETHSESMMLRFLRRIREGTLDPSAIQVYYIDQDALGNSKVHDLPIGSSGEFLAEWPNGFFDDRLKEITW